MKLSRIIERASEAYVGIAGTDDDQLHQFMVDELTESYDSNDSASDQLREARRVLRRGAERLRTVAISLED